MVRALSLSTVPRSSPPPPFQRHPLRVVPRKGKSSKKKGGVGEGEKGERAEPNYRIMARIMTLPGAEKGGKFLQVNCWLLKELVGNPARTEGTCN